MNENARPMFLYRVFQIFAFVGAIPFIVNTVDVVLHPSAMPLGGVMSSHRLVTAVVLAPLTLVIAILCIRRAPKNIIGWMLVVFAYGTSSIGLRRDLLPLVPTLLIANTFIGAFWTSYLLIPLYFPNGYLYPPRFTLWANRIVGIIVALSFLLPYLFNRTLVYGMGESALYAPNPFFVAEFNYTIITAPLGIFGLIIGGVVTLILRYRRGSTLERLQMRWLLAGVVLQVVLVITLSWLDTLGINSTVFSTLYTVFIPVAIGIAILRHRLYDIDVIIRRTLIYSILTAALAALYFSGVVLAQGVLRALTGQSSDLAIVLSTLGIAALFNPLRHRIQRTIDRRFFRRKYNAERTLEAFSLAIRDEVDLEKLQVALVGVVQETMQPTKVALWIKE